MAWINDYTPLHLDLLQELDDTIDTILTELTTYQQSLDTLQEDINQIIISANNTRIILEELNDIVDEEYIHQKEEEIENVHLHRGFIAPSNNGQLVIDQNYYSELINDDPICSDNSLWLILTTT